MKKKLSRKIEDASLVGTILCSFGVDASLLLKDSMSIIMSESMFIIAGTVFGISKIRRIKQEHALETIKLISKKSDREEELQKELDYNMKRIDSLEEQYQKCTERFEEVYNEYKDLIDSDLDEELYNKKVDYSKDGNLLSVDFSKNKKNKSLTLIKGNN